MNYHRAVDWFRTALEVAMVAKNKEMITTAKNYLKTTMKAHDKVLEQKGQSGITNGKSWETNVVPYDEKLRKKKKYKKALMELNQKEKNHEMSFVNSISSPVLNEQFNRLCKGEILLSPSHSKDIKCFSLHHFDPYLRLGPFKLDDQSISPYVTVLRTSWLALRWNITKSSHDQDFSAQSLGATNRESRVPVNRRGFTTTMKTSIE